MAKNQTKTCNRASRRVKPGREVTTDKIARRRARRMRKGAKLHPKKGWLIGAEYMAPEVLYADSLEAVRSARTK